MSGWVWQAWVGVLGGTLIFFGVLLPVLLYQVRRYGRMSFRRALGGAALSVYAVALVAYTLLPLPAARENCVGGGGGSLELAPGHSFADIARDTAGMSLSDVLTSPATFQVVMNVALFVPFGVILRRFLGRGVATSVVTGAFVSLLIEATQFTAIWGLYECSYRVADVDDVLANTLGAAIGVLLAPFVLGWMPSARALRAGRDTPRAVTVWRRWFGMLLDSIAIHIAIGLLSVALAIWGVLGQAGAFLPSPPASIQVCLIFAGTVVLTVVVPASFGSGASFGQRLVFLAPRTPRQGFLWKRILRAGSVAIPYIASILVRRNGATEGWISPSLETLVMLVSLVVVATAVMSVPFTRQRRGLSFAVARLELVDSRRRDDVCAEPDETQGPRPYEGRLVAEGLAANHAQGIQ